LLYLFPSLICSIIIKITNERRYIYIHICAYHHMYIRTLYLQINLTDTKRGYLARSICWTVCVYLMSTYVRSLAAKKCFEGLSDRNTPRRRTAASKCCHTPAMTAATHFVMTSGGCGGAHITKRRYPARPSAMSPGRLRTAPKTPVNVASRRKCLTVVANVVPQGDALPPPAVFNVSRSVSTKWPYSHDALVKLD